MTDLRIDDRLPALAEIQEPNRQQLRRIARRGTPCAKCRRRLTVDDVCFADGKDVHRFCAETWNAELLAAWEQLKDQDASAASERSALSMGLAIPKGGSALWTPSTANRQSSTPAAAEVAA
jgi:hypothetical protein